MPRTILKIDASARTAGSMTRELTADIVAQLAADKVITRDLAAEPLPQLTEDWVGANFSPADARDAAQNAVLAQSDALVAELRAADTLVIGAPIYNFSVPAALKAWIDLVARVGLTFNYTESGPKGLLEGKKAIIALASGGTQAESAIDFATPYLRQFLGFIGITDVTVIAADQLGQDAEAKRAAVKQDILALAA